VLPRQVRGAVFLGTRWGGTARPCLAGGSVAGYLGGLSRRMISVMTTSAIRSAPSGMGVSCLRRAMRTWRAMASC
jgi:hypothetical protein